MEIIIYNYYFIFINIFNFANIMGTLLLNVLWTFWNKCNIKKLWTNN